QPANFSDWTIAPDGVDIIRNKGLIQMHFPNFAMDIKTIIHIRRAGDISSQQLGQHMIEVSQKGGLRRITGSVRGIEMVDGFKLDIKADGMTQTLKADILINAAGPFVEKIARMIGFKLPVQNILQQKIAFEDKKDVLPRNLPFSVDIDFQMIN
ncbi:MAG: FAD-dependent oxidoreductase, partial [Candidatus Poribacteria bacterium]|nr:FAD-dependent oxidoreductase [Candidatus Poribacteria bacterium]